MIQAAIRSASCVGVEVVVLVLLTSDLCACVRYVCDNNKVPKVFALKVPPARRCGNVSFEEELEKILFMLLFT